MHKSDYNWRLHLENCKHIGTLIVIVFLAVLPSCTAVQEETAFERVVDYYRSEGDTLKMRAAEFLRDNAMWHYGECRQLNKPFTVSYTDILDSPETKKDSVFEAYLDSMGYSITKGAVVWDSDTVSEDFLRENIDLAFDSWSKPWARDVSFDDFCKYILPYRNGDEELSGWRRMLKERYEPSIMDSVSDPTSHRQVVDYLMRQIRRDVEYGGSMGPFAHDLLAPSLILQLHWLECANCAHYTTLAMRACGIPCAMMEIHWRFTEVTHSTVLFPAIGTNKRDYRLSVGDTLIYMGEPKDTMAAWRVWEYDYEVDSNRLDLYDIYGDKAALRQQAWPVTLSDVTSKMCRTFDFSVPVPDSLRLHRYLFLCRFHNWKWLPVREGLVDGDSVRFHDATIRQWYRLGYVNGDSISTFGPAFTLVGDDGIADIKDRIRPYDLSGDTILFRLAYRDQLKAPALRRTITTNYWGSDHRWHALTGEAILWGFNPTTGEYREYDEGLGNKGFRPDFHLLDVRLPRWTVFFDEGLGNPFGFLKPDEETGEGCLMQF